MAICLKIFFGFQPDYVDNDALINGNDAVELFEYDEVVDQFGETNIDGTGQAWEYKDGWAYRKSRQENNHTAFDASKWYYSGIDNLEGGPTNTSCDAPFPIGTFEALPLLTSVWAGPVSFTTAPVLPECDGDYYDNGGANANYKANSNDTITVCPDLAGYAVSVKFDLFDIQSDGLVCMDELIIYDGESTTANKISPNGADSWCWDLNASPPAGSGNLKDQVIESTHSSGCLTFVFRSDAALEGMGWEATVNCLPVENCIEPTELLTANITENSVDISWTEVSEHADKADIVYGLAGIAVEDGTLVENVNVPYQLTGLTPSTAYDVYVRQQCGLFGTSEWIGPQRFLTSCSSDYGDEIINPIIVSGLPFSSQSSTKDCYTDNIGNSSADAFYQFTTGPCTYSIRASTCNEFSDFDTYLRLLDSLGNEIITNDDAAPEDCSNSIDGLNRLSVLDIQVQPNTKYYIVVEGFGPNEGLYQLDIDVSDISYIETSMITRNITCYSGNDGLIAVEAMNGAEPFTYQWSTGGTSSTISGLTAGLYQVTITDACDERIIEAIELDEPTPILAAPTITNVTDSDVINGAIVLDVAGGTAPYIFRWDNGAQTKNLADLSAGTYCVTITDWAGCSAEACFEVESELVSVQQIDDLLSLEIMPNPTSSEAFIKLQFKEATDINVFILSSAGQLMHEFADRQVMRKEYGVRVEDYPSGIYFVQIQYQNYSFSYKLVVSH